MILNTSELKPGDRVRLISFGDIALTYRQKLLAFGLTQGVTVSIIRRAPLGCPIQILVRGISLMLRENEAKNLQWEYA